MPQTGSLLMRLITGVINTANSITKELSAEEMSTGYRLRQVKSQEGLHKYPAASGGKRRTKSPSLE
jgi:hypothetical protein